MTFLPVNGELRGKYEASGVDCSNYHISAVECVLLERRNLLLIRIIKTIYVQHSLRNYIEGSLAALVIFCVFPKFFLGSVNRIKRIIFLGCRFSQL